MRQFLEVIVDLWETGNWWARAAIVFVFVPPVVALLLALAGFRVLAAAMSLTPLLVLAFVPLAMIDPLVIAVVAGALGLHPTATAVRQWLARWVPFYLGAMMTLGVYLYFVPISNDPSLVVPLIGAISAVGVFAVAGRRGIACFFATVAIGITVAFFFGSKKAEEGKKVVAAEEKVGVEEFSLNAGEERFTVLVGPGTQHRILANKPWVALARDDHGTYRRPEGNYRPYEMPAGPSVWNGGPPAGPLLVKGVEDGTTLHFERVR